MEKFFLFAAEDLRKLISEVVHQEFRADTISEKQAIPDDLLSQNDAAKFLRKSVPTIITWRRERNLPHYNFNGNFFYSKSELLEYGRSGSLSHNKCERS